MAAERDPADLAGGRKVEFLDPLLTVFKHVEGHRQFWKPLTRKGGADVVVRILRESVEDILREHLRSRSPGSVGDQTQLEAALQFVGSACMGLLIWWIDDDVPYSAEEIHSIFRRLTTQGVRRFLAAA